MSEKTADIETVTIKFEDLDNELNIFLEAINEIKEIRDTVGTLPEKLLQSEKDIEKQKHELHELKSSANNVLISVGEQARGVIFDLEKKTEDLTSEVKSGITRINNLFQEGNSRLEDRYKEETDNVLIKYKELEKALESKKDMMDSHEKSINTLKNNYIVVSSIFAKLELSLLDLKKKISELQKKPFEVSKKIKELENRLDNLTAKKNSDQKSFPWPILVAVTSVLMIAAFALYMELL